MPNFNDNMRGAIDGEWLRPKTTRRYLHPPKAERMFTLWREGKIILGDVVRGIDHRSYAELDCAGIWLVHTRRARPFDMRRAESSLCENGAPIHSLTNSFGGFTVDMEAFCNIERRPTCFVKITVKSNAPYKASDRIGLLLRSGKESELVHGSPDEYLSYDPEIADFKDQPVSFKNEGGVYRSGEYFMTASTDLPLCFNEESGLLLAELCLEAQERTEIILSFGKGTEFAFDYETEKQKTLRFWEGELERINRLSPKISADKELVRAIQNLTVQTLQCFCYYVGEESLVLRQGGLQRLIWPWEAMNAIDALSRLGSFEDYIEPVLQMYFETMHRENGEISNIGEGWASVTSSALCSLVKYCAATDNAALWKKYREKALKTFDWIREKRRSTEADPKAISGLFPAMRGNDWPDVFQHWTVTDCFALVALDEMASMLEKFGDPAASAVRAEYLDYKSVIRSLFKKFAPEDAEEIRIPLTANGNDSGLINNFYPYLHQPMPLMVLKEEISLRDVERLYKYFVRVGLTQNGLYDRMPYKDGNTHIWYTSIAEYEWFTLWLHFGLTDKAEEIIEAQFRYSMTDEYYMIERYADNDPYFVPWSPNVSAMGRLIIMLTEFYK